jgi:hypothetical protein
VKTAQHLGRLRQAKSFLALLALVEGQSVAPGAVVLRGHEQTGRPWRRACCCYGLQGAPHRQPPGRPPTLTPTPKAARVARREAGPVQAGFSGACGRSPMIQPRLYERVNVYYKVFYIAQWRKH